MSIDDKDSIEVAQQCIAESFDVDLTDKAAMSDALGGQNLLSIYGVYEKLRGKGTASTAGSSSAKEARSSTPAAPAAGPTLTAEQKQEAENLKGQGNSAMAKKDYKNAIDLYSKAVNIMPTNPVYLSNRAAAYSASSKHEKAVIDAEAAVAADPKYTKAWSRLGLARYALGDAKGSMEAYQKGIDAEGNGGSPAMKKGFETAKKKIEEEEALGGIDDVGSTPRGPGAGGMPDLSGLASMLGGGGAGGAGSPDLGSLLNNPMFANMAQNLMSNPDMMNNIMSNPQLRQMAESFGGGGAAGGGRGSGGGGQPDLSSLLQDPSIAEM